MKISSLHFGLFFSLILLLTLGVYYQDLSVFITYFFFFITGKVLLKKQDHTVKKLQNISFFINVSSAVLLTFSFEYLHETWYSFGQDDFTFYTIATDISKDNYIFHVGTEYLEWGSIQYKLYVLFFGYWFKILNLIGIGGNFFFHLNIINSFVASFIAPFVYKIGLNLFGNTSETPKMAAFISLLFPTLIYYSSVIIRDSWIIALFLIIVYVVISNKRIIKKMILIFVLLLFIFFLRKSSAIFVTFFIILYSAFNTNNSYVVFFMNKVIPISILIIVVTFFTAIQLPVPEVAPPNSDILNYISYTVNFYRELSAGEAVESSLGLRLRLSNNPIISLVYYVYFYLSPIPPLFLKDFNLINVFIGIGNILWYILSPLYFLHSIQLRNTNNNIFVKSFFWFLILIVIVVATATGEQRHLLFLYPLVLLFSIDYILNHKKQFYRYLLFFFFFSFFLFLVYLFIKLII